MSQYPPETMRSLDQQAARQDKEDAAGKMQAQMFEDAVRSGSDILLLFPGAVSRAQFPVSTFLGECSKDAQAALFRACTEAMNGRDSGEALRAFVSRVAAEYAFDIIGEWGIEE
jgi:hypothetical protein